MARSGISGYYGKCMFNFGTNCRTVFRSSCTIGVNAPVSLHPPWHLVLSAVSFTRSFYLAFILAILIGTDWYLVLGLICISLKTNENWVFVHVLVSQLYVLFGNLSIQIFCSFFLIGLFVVEFLSSFDILDASYLSDMWLRDLFSQYVAGLLLLLASFSEQNFRLDKVKIINYFLSWIKLFEAKSKKSFPNPRSQRFSLKGL